MRFLLVTAVLYLGSCKGFLFDDLTTPRTNSGSSLTDKHFVALVDMITQERQSRETYMLQLKQKIIENENKALALEATINKMNSKNDTVVDKIEFEKLKTDFLQKYQSLEQKYLLVVDENDRLKLQVNSSELAINKMELELVELKTLNAINELQEIQSLSNDNAIVKQQINGLLSTQQARGQDFLALYNQTVDIKTQIKTMDKEIMQQNRTSQLLKKDTVRLENEIKEASGKIVENSKKVAVTACIMSGTYAGNVPIPFPYIITSYGIHNLSSITSNGDFTCEYSGMYIVSVTIVSKSNDANFHVYKNNRYLIDAYSRDVNKSYDSGTGMVVVDMNVNDTINVRPFTNGIFVYGTSPYQTSCLSVVKVK